MEDTLWDYKSRKRTHQGVVLILVLMEDTLWVEQEQELLQIEYGLNPCFNGRYSMSYRNVFTGSTS